MRHLYVPDEGSLLPKYSDCTTSNDFELYLMCCGVMLLLLSILYIYTYAYVVNETFCNVIHICIYKTLNETAKGNFKNTLIQLNIYNVQDFRPHPRSSSVVRRQLKSTNVFVDKFVDFS